MDIEPYKSPRLFRYIADPVCIASLLIYTLNRFWLKPNRIGGWFTHGYLNDVLCLPLFVPIILYVEHLVGVRHGLAYPRWWEILQSWLVFTIVFQMILPRYPAMFVTASDPWDILAYLIGGILGGAWWKAAEVRAK